MKDQPHRTETDFQVKHLFPSPFLFPLTISSAIWYLLDQGFFASGPGPSFCWFEPKTQEYVFFHWSDYIIFGESLTLHTNTSSNLLKIFRETFSSDKLHPAGLPMCFSRGEGPPPPASRRASCGRGTAPGAPRRSMFGNHGKQRARNMNHTFHKFGIFNTKKIWKMFAKNQPIPFSVLLRYSKHRRK